MKWPFGGYPVGIMHAAQAPYLAVVDEFGGVIGVRVESMAGAS